MTATTVTDAEQLARTLAGETMDVAYLYCHGGYHQATSNALPFPVLRFGRGFVDPVEVSNWRRDQTVRCRRVAPSPGRQGNGVRTMTVVGAVVFGFVVGYLTYRTLARAEQTAATDLNAIIAAIGGGAVTQLFDPAGDTFAWYPIGLAAGMALFFAAFWKMNGKAELAKVMGRPTTGHRSGDGGPQA